MSFQAWIDSCTAGGGGGGPDEAPSRLRSEARLHFESLSSSSSAGTAAADERNTSSAPPASPSPPSKSSSTVADDVSRASSSTPNGALARLVSSLGPILSSTTASADARVRALHCLVGALEGCAELTHGVRQAVGRFLVELCRPGGSEGDDMDAEEGGDGDVGGGSDYVDGANLTPDEITERLKAMSSNKRSRTRGGASSSPVRDDARDAAVLGLRALLRSDLELFPTQQSQSPEAKKSQQCPVTKAMGVVHQSMELRVELAVLGLRYRCQVDESDELNDDRGIWGGGGAGYETGHANLNIEDGLSQLPRAKRSVCFDLLDGALDGLERDDAQAKRLEMEHRLQTARAEFAMPPSLLRSMSMFATLASSCMHGETDPRCLLQLLRLLNRVQRIMLPLFARSARGRTDSAERMDVDEVEGGVPFPSVQIFDAVAPYYPVQFTPPKNDPHGITRDMLQGALMAVLCEKDAHYDCQIASANHKGQGDDDNESMITLSARMFLERLEPSKSSDYDPPSDGAESEVEDRLSAVGDLSALFLPQPPAAAAGQHYSENVTRVTPAFLTEVSSTMARVHEEAVSSDTKSLASAVRKFSSSLAYTLEPISRTEAGVSPLWDAYVVDVLHRRTTALATAPQGMHGRASTAYFASMAADGGLMTLRKVLDVCYPRFLGVLSLLGSDGEDADMEDSSTEPQSNKRKSRDEEKLAAAMRGVAALVSSCRVALQKWQGENPGAKVHPHPLRSYASDTIRKISFVLNEALDEDGLGSLSLASLAALESVLTSVDLGALEADDLSSMERSISSISRVLLNEEGAPSNDSPSVREWKTACARVLGAVVAVGLCHEGSDETVAPGLNASAAALLPQLLASATSPPRASQPRQTIRYDWIVLAGACANGKAVVSEQIVSDILTRIITALRSQGGDEKASAMVLSYLIRNGGSNVGTAFHSSPPSGPTQLDIIQELCQPLRDDNVDGQERVVRGQLQVGMSQLQLPESRARDEEVAIDAMKRAHCILPILIPAYEHPSSIQSCGSIVQFVDQILPPLSEWDEVKLYVALPLLAAVLNSSNKAWSGLESDTLATLKSMTTYLAQFSISPEHAAPARSAAASCLFSTLFHSSDGGGGADAETIQTLLKEVVSPVLTSASNGLSKEVLNDSTTPRASGSAVVETSTLLSAFSRVNDALSMMSVLGSVSACRGGPLAQTGDKIASFFIELACTGTSQFPFTEVTMQLATPNEQGRKHPLLSPAAHAYILPASAFGSMLSVQNGGPFWRQRMTHKTLPILMKALQAQAKSQDPPALGTLAVVSHMLCCLPASLLGESNTKQILPTLIAGLVYFSKNLDTLSQSGMVTSKSADLLTTMLAALVKILKVSPGDVAKFVGIIIPSLLLLCSATELSESYIPKQLLVLQCLETVASHPQARNAILREKDQVVAVLSAVVDHPSMLVRNAVVQARNVWYTLV